jgi:branched-chain amino acid transport system permease protein
LSSLQGAVYGALFIQFVPRVAEQVSKSAPWAVYGAILIVLVLLWPTGAAGGIRHLKNRFLARNKP